MNTLTDEIYHAIIDEHWDINQKLKGADYVHACMGINPPHLNLTYCSNRQLHHVEIPNLKVKILDKKSLVLTSE